jgi:hypothetical protein
MQLELSMTDVENFDLSVTNRFYRGDLFCFPTYDLVPHKSV